MADDEAERLERITANLGAYIEERAQQIAAPRIAVAEEDAARKVADLEAEHTASKQQSDDLVAELRRQLQAVANHMDKCRGQREREKEEARSFERFQIRMAWREWQTTRAANDGTTPVGVQSSRGWYRFMVSLGEDLNEAQHQVAREMGWDKEETGGGRDA